MALWLRKSARSSTAPRGWAFKWLNRFDDEEGLEGLKTKERSGRLVKLDHREFVSVKRNVVNNECG
jgi:hypothetical protein